NRLRSMSMKLANISALSAITLLFAGAAVAQEQPSPAAPSPDRQTSSPAPAEASPAPAAAPSAMASGVNASTSNPRVITNGPVPDTPENRAAFPPLSQTGRNTTPKGN